MTTEKNKPSANEPTYQVVKNGTKAITATISALIFKFRLNG